MKKDSRYIWYLLDTLVFVGINIFILSTIDISRLFIAVESLSWFKFIVIALGVYRLTDIITEESVTEFIRAPFMDKILVEGQTKWEISEKGFRGFLGTLLSCNACMGVWVSMVVGYLYVFFGIPILVFMGIMALTGFERFFSKFENFLAKRG